MIKGPNVFNIYEPVKLPRRPLAALSRPETEKQALVQALKALHDHELERVGFHILRLLGAGREKHELQKFTEAFRRTYVYPPTGINILYDEIEGGKGVAADGRSEALFIYVPFETGREKLVLKLFMPGCETLFGDLVREPTEVLMEQRFGEYTCQYLWAEDYEDIRLYYIQQTFDADAGRPFAEQRNQTFLKGHKPFRELMAYQIPALAGKGKRVLSIGPGEGDFEEILVREHGMEVVGVDLSPKMAEIARGKGIHVMVGDGHELSRLVSGKFDAIIFPESIGYFNPEKVLEEASQVLVPGGKLFIITYTVTYTSKEGVISGYRRYPYEDLKRMIEAHCFRIERARTFVVLPGQEQIAISKEGADLSQAEKEAPVLYIRAARI